MVFSSVIFLFYFFPISVIAGTALKDTKHLKNVFLLFMSLLFYGWGEPRYIGVLILSIFINYLAGVMMEKSQWKKTTLVISVVLNLAILFFFKYYTNSATFINSILGNISDVHFKVIKVALPIGISFFTFQGMSYVIDVYRGNAKVQRNPLYVALYISLFPQLIAGPIVRYSVIADELDNRVVNTDGIYNGIKRFIVGLSKKVLLADTLAYTADKLFAVDPTTLTPAEAWLGIICYTLQLYFDFSGYSDMAIGLGGIFGFHFPENFLHPYTASSIADFWRKWHVTLSSWFRDYVYIPLGGNRRGNVYLHLFIVFVLTGIWHGASLTFVAWGLWHGVFIIAERLLNNKLKIDIGKFKLSRIYTLLVVMLGWVFFKCETFDSAFHYIGALFGVGTVSDVFVPFSLPYYVSRKLIVLLIISVIYSLYPASVHKLGGLKILKSEKRRAIGLLILLVLCAITIVKGNYSPFIYFRF